MPQPQYLGPPEQEGSPGDSWQDYYDIPDNTKPPEPQTTTEKNSPYSWLYIAAMAALAYWLIKKWM